MPNILPAHIAIVMDGNGRWAEQRKLPRIAGHQAGAKAVEIAIQFAAERKIPVLSLFAFSSENWARPEKEVSFLMELLFKTLQRQTKSLHKNNIQLRIVGDCSRFSPKLQEKIAASQQLTAKNTGLKLVLAINYSGRWDITNAAQRLAIDIENGKLIAKQITQDLFQNYLSMADLPDPDLLIRTSGEQRISNFMLWQAAYTELYFTDVLWPDFTAEEFNKALISYANRQRRFGLTGAQIHSESIEQS